MSTIANAWDAFMRALEEARDLQERGASANELSELLRHARELLDIIERGSCRAGNHNAERRSRRPCATARPA